jgi:hypothetical protein
MATDCAEGLICIGVTATTAGMCTNNLSKVQPPSDAAFPDGGDVPEDGVTMPDGGTPPPKDSGGTPPADTGSTPPKDSGAGGS